MEKQYKIYNQLMGKYFDYYYSVYYEIVYEAINYTLQDFKNRKNYTIEDIHKNIIENYI